MLIDSFIHFTVFLVFLIFSLYVFMKSSGIIKTGLYGLLFLCFSIWSLGFVFLSLSSISRSLLSISLHVSSIASLCYGVLVFLSIVNFTRSIPIKKWLLLTLLIYISVAFALQVNGYLFMPGDSYMHGYWSITVKSTLAVLILNIIHNSLVVASLVILFVYYLRSKDALKKKQSKIILLTGIVSYALSFTFIHLQSHYPILREYYYPDLALVVFMVGIAYSNFRLEIFEITPSTVANRILKIMPSGILITDRDFKVVSINDQFTKISGVKSGDIIDKPFPDLFLSLSGRALPGSRMSFSEKLRLASGNVVFWKFEKIYRGNVLMGSISTLTDISKEETTENELRLLNQTLEQRVLNRTRLLQHRGKYLSAINEANTLLLRSRTVPYGEFLRLIGDASGASRSYIFLNHSNSEGDLLMSQVAEYVKEGIKAEIDNSELQNLPYNKFTPGWETVLASGEVISKKTEELPDNQRKFFESQNIKALLLIPVLSNNDFYGFVGFDNCETSKEWPESEQELLRMAVYNLESRIMIEEIQNKLLISEERYRVILEQSNDAIFVIRNDLFKYVNSYFIDLFGYNIEELNKLPLIVYKNNEEKVRVNRLVESFRNEDSSRLLDFTAKTKKGKLVRCELKYSKLHKGNDIIIQGIIRDITQKEKDAYRLRQLSTAVNQSPVSIIITNKEGLIEYVNPKFSELTGYSTAEVIGKKPNILKSGVKRKEEYGKLWKTIHSGKEWHGEFENRNKNGENYYESAIISPIKNDKDEITHFIAIKEDITKRKKAEEKIRQSKMQLEKLAMHLQNAREEERINISRELHDNLGQSLTALRLFLFRLKKKVSKHQMSHELTEIMELNNDIIEYVDNIIMSVKQIARNIRPLIIEDIGLVNAIKMQVEEFAENTGMYADFFTDTELIPLNESHSTGVYRIIQESLTNVARHAGASKVVVSIHSRKNECVIKVRDNGCGIEQDEIKKKRSLGIMGMQERAYIFDGKLNMIGYKNKGTVVELIIPLNK